MIAQGWVDGALSYPGSGSLPDRPQIVYETYEYDRASNRTGKDDARHGSAWLSQDNDYSYDMLDRLNLAIRGQRNSTTWSGTITHSNGGVSGRDSSQQWNLDMLGNWAGDPDATTPVPGFIHDSNGDGDFNDGPTTDLADVRHHNASTATPPDRTRSAVAPQHGSTWPPGGGGGGRRPPVAQHHRPDARQSPAPAAAHAPRSRAPRHDHRHARPRALSTSLPAPQGPKGRQCMATRASGW